MNDNSRDVWVSRQDTGQLALYGVIAVAVGLGFIMLVRQASSLSSVTSTSAFLLGLLILILGLAALVMNGEQVISVDPKRRRVLIETASRFGKKRRIISFRDIANVSLGEIGDIEGGSISYFVQLDLKNGKDVGLFVGFYGGNWSKGEMEARRQRLIEYLGASV
jgi:hypothetical protein